MFWQESLIDVMLGHGTWAGHHPPFRLLNTAVTWVRYDSSSHLVDAQDLQHLLRHEELVCSQDIDVHRLQIGRRIVGVLGRVP